MSKIIVDNQTDLSMAIALQYVIVVIHNGRISNDGKQYCYATGFNEGIMVWAQKNDKSDRFVITRNQK